MKIALAFFGITRSLKYTIDTINKNVLDVFRINNIDFTIFMHTYKLDTYTNQRTGEHVDNVDNEEYKLLNPDYLLIHDQNKIKKLINMPLYRSHKDPWNTNYNSVDNFILAQYSKSNVVNLIHQTGVQYDYVIFIRPDCSYFTRFNINWLRFVNNNTICTPNFGLFGKYNFNDRFCISNMRTYKLYGDIFPHLLYLSKKISLHSETVLGGLMLHKYKLNIKQIPFIFAKVRSGGVVCKVAIQGKPAPPIRNPKGRLYRRRQLYPRGQFYRRGLFNRRMH